MTYPTAGAYQEALQFPADAFSDPDLRTAVPDAGPLGLPAAVTGAYAAVFPMTGPHGARWAVKVFTSAAPDVHARYRAVARALADTDLPYFVPFDYRPEGIRVDGAWWPVVRMDWAAGRTLGRWVAERRAAPDALLALADAWDRLLADLEAAGLAHGDLQHGNVLVADGADGVPRLTLVDYDALYVPALAGRGSGEAGHRNYQHPDRDARDFGPHLDRFAGLVVATALRALAARPELWDAYDTGENLLFRADDFYDPGSSALFETLRATPAVRPYAEALATACLLESDAAPRVADVAAGTVSARPAGRRRTRRSERARPAVRGPFERWFAPSAAAWAGSAGLLALGGSVAAAALVVVLAASAMLGAAAWTYRRRPAVRRRRRLRGELDYFARLISTLEAEAGALDAAHARAFDDLEAVKAERLEALREAALEDHLKHHFIGEAATFEGVSHKVVVRMKAAGIRTAYHATPDRLAALREVGPESKARVGLWRAGLVAEVADTLPARLSPAEARRMDRLVARRADEIAAEAARTRDKIRVQQSEQDAARTRLDALPADTFGGYLRWLLRLAAAPEER